MAQIKLGKFELKNYELPALCMVCGKAATTTRNKKFSWNPGWVYLLLLVGLLPCLIVALIMTKRMRLDAPLCDAHRNHWSLRNWFTGLGILGFLGAFIGGLILLPNNLTGGFVVGSIALFLVGLIALAVWQSTAIRASEITNHGITLQGVSRKFVDAVREERVAQEDDDEDPVRPPSRQQPARGKERNYSDERPLRSDDRRRYREEDDDEEDD